MKIIRWIPVVIIVVIVGAVVAWFMFQKSVEPRNETQRTQALDAEKQQQKKLVSDMAQKWNAVEYTGSWPEERKLGHEVFTIDIEDCLIRPDGRPSLFIGTVEDVQRRGDKYVVHIDCWRAGIDCLLECDAVQVGKFRSKTDVGFYEFAVVAKIISVKRPFFQVTATTESGDADTESGDAEIVVDSPKTFVATGVCLDLVGPSRWLAR